MSRTVTFERAEAIPEDATVRHYDELTGEAQRRFPALAAGVPADSVFDGPATTEFTDGEYLVFTGYYRVRVT